MFVFYSWQFNWDIIVIIHISKYLWCDWCYKKQKKNAFYSHIFDDYVCESILTIIPWSVAIEKIKMMCSVICLFIKIWQHLRIIVAYKLCWFCFCFSYFSYKYAVWCVCVCVSSSISAKHKTFLLWFLLSCQVQKLWIFLNCSIKSMLIHLMAMANNCCCCVRACVVLNIFGKKQFIYAHSFTLVFSGCMAICFCFCCWYK